MAETKTNGKERPNGSKSSFHKILDALPAAVYTTDAGGNITYFNPAAVEFSGRKPELGNDKWCVTWELYYPDGSPMPREECPMAVALNEGHPDFGHKAIAERPDGQRIWFMPYPSPIFDDEGTITGGINMLVDITERKNADQKQKELLRDVEAERQRLRDVFQHAPSIMATVEGPNHVFKQANARYKRLVDHRDLVGKTVADALPEVEDQGFIDLLDQVYQTGEPIKRSGERVMLEPPGGGETEEYFLDFVYQPMRDPGEAVTGVFIQAVNITARRRREQQLKDLNQHLEDRIDQRTATLLSYQKKLRSLALQLSRAEEEERRHLATELHDNLGQMLSVLKMKISSIQKQNDSDAIEEASQLVDESIQYTRGLMSDLKPPPSMEEDKISAPLKWVIKAMDQYHLNIHFTSNAQQEPSIDKDIQTALVQAVRELLFNVVKHSGSDEADVTLSFPNDRVKITVEDNGQGFDPDSTYFSVTDGGGFGLFHINERLDVLGGQVDIKSAPGEGAKITLMIPLEGNGNDQPAGGGRTADGVREQNERLAEEPASNVTVLLVDDHEMMRDGLGEIIGAEDDLTVIAEAADGETGIDLAEEIQPDVVIMDINLPGMNGIKATKIIKADHPEIKVIGLSFHEDEEVKQKMGEAGASAYLEKSNASEALCAAIRSEGK